MEEYWKLRKDESFSPGGRPVTALAEEISQIIYHDHLNVIIAIGTQGAVSVVDVNNGAVLHQAQLNAGKKGELRAVYLSSHGKFLITNGEALGMRSSNNGLLLIDTILQPLGDKNPENVQLEMTVNEASLIICAMKQVKAKGVDAEKIESKLLFALQEWGIEDSGPLPDSADDKWKIILIKCEYASLKTLMTKLIQSVKQSGRSRNTPILSVLSCIYDRLAAMVPILNPKTLDRSQMYSEVHRVETFKRWPHMGYKFANPDLMAQAGFYFQPNDVNEDRATCFSCGICLTTWEPGDEPWSEHERHSPTCAYVRGDSTQNVPLASIYSTSPALPMRSKLTFGTTALRSLFPTFTDVNIITIWDFSRVLVVVARVCISDVLWISPNSKANIEEGADHYIVNLDPNASLTEFRETDTNEGCTCVPESPLRSQFRIRIMAAGLVGTRWYTSYQKDLLAYYRRLEEPVDASVQAVLKEALGPPIGHPVKAACIVAVEQVPSETTMPSDSDSSSATSSAANNRGAFLVVYDMDYEEEDLEEETVSTAEVIEARKKDRGTILTGCEVSSEECEGEPLSPLSNTTFDVLGDTDDSVYSMQSLGGTEDMSVEDQASCIDLTLYPDDDICNAVVVSQTNVATEIDLDKTPVPSTCESGVPSETTLAKGTPSSCVKKATVAQCVAVPGQPGSEVLTVLPLQDGKHVLVVTKWKKNGRYLLYGLNFSGTVVKLTDKPVKVKPFVDSDSPVDICLLPVFLRCDDDYLPDSFVPFLAIVTKSGKFCLLHGTELKVVSTEIHPMATQESSEPTAESEPASKFVSVTYCSAVEKLCVADDLGRLFYFTTFDKTDEVGATSKQTGALISEKANLSPADAAELYELTKFSTVVPRFLANAPSSWLEINQAQRQRKCPQDVDDESQHTRSWKYTCDFCLWDEYLFEMRLPSNMLIGHVDFKFVLKSTIPPPPNSIQVTLLRRIGSDRKDGRFVPTTDEAESKVPFTLLSAKHANGDNPVLTKQYHGKLNTEVISGPVDLINYTDLTESSGTVPLTSPKLFQTYCRTVLVHVKIIAAPKEKDQQQQPAAPPPPPPPPITTMAEEEEYAALIASIPVETLSEHDKKLYKSVTEFQAKTDSVFNKNPCAILKSLMMPKGGQSPPKTKSTADNNTKSMRRTVNIAGAALGASGDDPLSKLADIIQEISITVRKPLSTGIANEKKERRIMLESDDFLNRLLTLLDKTEDKRCRLIIVDTLLWIASIRLMLCVHPGEEEAMAKSRWKFTSLVASKLPQILRCCFLEGDRSLAHKTHKLIVLCCEGERTVDLLVNRKDYGEFSKTLIEASSNLLDSEMVSLFASSGAARWFFQLVLYAMNYDAKLVLPKTCFTSVLALQKKISELPNPYHQLLRSRYGLYGNVLDPELFEVEPNVPVMLPNPNGVVPQSTFAAVVTGSNSNSVPMMYVVDTANSYYGNSLKTISLKDLISKGNSKCVTNNGINPFDIYNLMHVNGSTHMKGLAEVVPLHFTCHSASEGTKLEKIPPANKDSFMDNLAVAHHPPTSNLGLDTYTPDGWPPKMDEKETMSAAEKSYIFQDLYGNSLQNMMSQEAFQQFKNKIMPKVKAVTKNLPNEGKIPKQLIVVDSSMIGSVATTSNFSSAYPTQIRHDKTVYWNSPTNKTLQSSFPWHQLLNLPQHQFMSVERMSSGAKKFVVLDFGTPVVLTDIVIPSSPDLVSLAVDVWATDEMVDSKRLAVATDIGEKSLVLSDLQPPPVVQFIKITVIGRYGMLSSTAKIPLGCFYGNIYHLPGDCPVQCLSPNFRPFTDMQKNIVFAVMEDVLVRYNLACSKLKECLNPILESDCRASHHTQMFLNREKQAGGSSTQNGSINSDRALVAALYKDCVIYQHQLNVLNMMLRRMDKSYRRVDEIGHSSNPAKLRGITNMLLDTIIYLIAEDYKPLILKMTPIFSRLCGPETCQRWFYSVIHEDTRHQLTTANLLAYLFCKETWWSSFLVSTFIQAFSAKNMDIFAQDRLFVLMSYMGRKSIMIAGHANCLIEHVMWSVMECLTPLSAETHDSNYLRSQLDLNLISWLMSFLLQCLNAMPRLMFYDPGETFDKDSVRWNFMHNELYNSQTRKKATEGRKSRSSYHNQYKKWIHQWYDNSTSSGPPAATNCLIPFTTHTLPPANVPIYYPPATESNPKPQGSLIVPKQLTLIDPYPMQGPGVVSTQPLYKTPKNMIVKSIIKEHQTPNFSWTMPDPPEPQQSTPVLMKLGDGQPTLPKDTCLPLMRALATFILKMDFTCNVDLLLTTCKVFTRVYQVCEPEFMVWDVLTLEQLTVLMQMASRNSNGESLFGGPWATHALSSLLLDIIDMTYKRHMKATPASKTPTSSSSPVVTSMYEKCQRLAKELTLSGSSSDEASPADKESESNIIDMHSTMLALQKQIDKVLDSGELGAPKDEIKSYASEGPAPPPMKLPFTQTSKSTQKMIKMTLDSDEELDADEEFYHEESQEDIQYPGYSSPLPNADGKSATGQTWTDSSTNGTTKPWGGILAATDKKEPLPSGDENMLNDKYSAAVDARLELGMGERVEVIARHIADNSVLALPTLVARSSEIATDCPPSSFGVPNVARPWVESRSVPKDACPYALFSKAFETLFDKLLSFDRHLGLQSDVEELLQLWLMSSTRLALGRQYVKDETSKSLITLPIKTVDALMRFVVRPCLWPSTRLWHSIFKCLALLANTSFKDEAQSDNPQTTYALAILNHENFTTMLISFLSFQTSDNMAGEETTKAFIDLLETIKRLVNTTDNDMTFKNKMLEVMHDLVDTKGAIRLRVGPTDAQLAVIEFMNDLPFSHVGTYKLVNIVTRVVSLVYGFVYLANTVKLHSTLQCTPNASSCQSFYIGGVKTVTDDAQRTSLSFHSRQSICMVLLVWCSKVVKVTLAESHTLNSLTVIPTNSTSSAPNAINANLTAARRYYFADVLLDEAQTMNELFSALSLCYCSSRAGNECKDPDITGPRPSRKLTKNHTVGDALHLLLSTLSFRTTQQPKLISVICKHLRDTCLDSSLDGSRHEIRRGAKLCQPMMWIVMKLLNSEENVTLFSSEGGISLISDAFSANMSLVLNQNPSVISAIMQYLYGPSSASQPYYIKGKKKIPMDATEDGLVNFAPIGSIKIHDKRNQNADMLLQPAQTHRTRARSASWLHHFTPDEQFVNLFINLPCAILLKEVHVHPLQTTLTSSPRMIAIEICRAGSSVFVPLGSPITTAGSQVIQVNVYQPEVVTGVMIRCYRPVEAYTLSLTQIRLLGYPAFYDPQNPGSQNRLKNGKTSPTTLKFVDQSDLPTLDQITINAFSWIRLLHHCLQRLPCNSAAERDVIAPMLNAPYLVETLCGVMLVPPPLPHHFIEASHYILSRMAYYSDDVACDTIDRLLKTGEDSTVQMSSEIADAIFELIIKMCVNERRVCVVMQWMKKVALLGLSSDTNNLQKNSLPKATFVYCVAAVLWRVTTHIETPEKVVELLDQETMIVVVKWVLALPSSTPLKRSVDRVLQAMCSLVPHQFGILMAMMELTPVNQVNDNNADSMEFEEEMPLGPLEENKMTTLALVSQIKPANEMFWKTDIPQKMMKKLEEFCVDKTSRTIVNVNAVIIILDFFSEWCWDAAYRTWLAPDQWEFLIRALCAPRDDSTLSLREWTRIDTAAIKFMCRTCWCHGANKKQFCAIVHKYLLEIASSDGNMSEFMRRILLQVILDKDRIYVSICSNEKTEEVDRRGPAGWCTEYPPHPAYPLIKHHRLFYVPIQSPYPFLAATSYIPNNKPQMMSDDDEGYGVEEVSVENFALLDAYASTTTKIPFSVIQSLAKEKRNRDTGKTFKLKKRKMCESDTGESALRSEKKEMENVNSWQTGKVNYCQLYKLTVKPSDVVYVPRFSTLSQMLRVMEENGPVEEPLIRLATVTDTDPEPPKGKVLNMEKYFGLSYSMLDEFAKAGGLKAVAQNMPLIYPTYILRYFASFVPEKSKSQSAKSKEGSWADSYDVFEADLAEMKELTSELNDSSLYYASSSVGAPSSNGGSNAVGGGKEKKSKSSHSNMVATILPPYTLIAFVQFLKLDTYEQTLIEKNELKAKCLLRLALGATDDGEDGAVLKNEWKALAILPFQILLRVFSECKPGSELPNILRHQAMESGSMEVVLGCLSVFTHQSEVGNLDGSGVVSAIKESCISMTTQSQKDSKGNGQQYWAKGTGFGTGSTTQSWNIDQALSRQQFEEEHVTLLFKILSYYLNCDSLLHMKPLAFHTYERTCPTSNSMASQSDIIPVRFVELMEQSCLVPALIYYLRNDSVLDMSKHIPLYMSIMELLRSMVVSPGFQQWFVPPKYRSGHFRDSNQTWLLLTLFNKMKTCVETYHAQMMKNRTRSSLLDCVDSDEPDKCFAGLIDDIMVTSKIIEFETNQVIAKLQPASENSEELADLSAENEISSLSLEEVYIQFMRNMQFESYDMISESAPFKFNISHHFEATIKTNNASSCNVHRMKRLAQETVTISTSLPLSFSSSVFVRYDTDRLDIMKVLVTGPSDTPYCNGCFEFDVYFPPEYPQQPMMINLETTGSHTVRFNPNLYNDGKVCLSVLNTWHGRPEEKWNPTTSSFLQVLVSIQSLILVPEPYFNEPGYERSRGTAQGNQSSKEYNSNIMQATVRWAMIEQLRNPSPCFKKVIHSHFWLKKGEILQQVECWLSELERDPPTDATKRSARTLGSNINLLRENFKILQEELKKLKPPPGLEMVDNDWKPPLPVPEEVSVNNAPVRPPSYESHNWMEEDVVAEVWGGVQGDLDNTMSDLEEEIL